MARDASAPDTDALPEPSDSGRPLMPTSKEEKNAGGLQRGQSPATKKTQSPFSVIPTRCPV